MTSINEKESNAWRRKNEFIIRKPKAIGSFPLESFHKYHITKCNHQDFVVPWQMNKALGITNANGSPKNLLNPSDGKKSIKPGL